ncbi:MAG: class I SAM-dependent methyltransferase [Candidatus Eisenbacteria bacterium]
MPAAPEPDAIPAGVPAPASFIRAARAALRQSPAAVDPWFHGYLDDLLDDAGLRTWVRAKHQLLALAGGVQDRVVVDAGSGFGMVANLLAAWGARRVWAVDVHERMVHSHALVNRAHFGELHGRVLPVVADSARLPLPTASASN